MKKTTLATIKKFILKSNNLYIKNISNFSGMTDSVEYLDKPTFRLATFQTHHSAWIGRDNCLGVQGAWFVFGSRDYFREYDDGEYLGYEIYNCCGKFVLATPKHIIFHPANVIVINNEDLLTT